MRRVGNSPIPSLSTWVETVYLTAAWGLIDCLLSPQSDAFGKLARAQLRPMCRKFSPSCYFSSIPLRERFAPRTRKEVVDACTPRVAIPRPRRHRWIIYAGDAANPPMRSPPHGERPPHASHTACSARTPALWSSFRPATLTYGVWISALSRFFEATPTSSGIPADGRIWAAVTSSLPSFAGDRILELLQPYLPASGNWRIPRIFASVRPEPIPT